MLGNAVAREGQDASGPAAPGIVVPEPRPDPTRKYRGIRTLPRHWRGASHRVSIRACRIRPTRRTRSVSGVL